jgi:hypothetical protein
VLGGTALHLETSGAGRAGRSQPQDICHGPALKMAMVKLDGLYPPLVSYGSAGRPMHDGILSQLGSCHRRGRQGNPLPE